MIYLSGCVRTDLPNNIGFMLQPRMWNHPDLSRRVWAADNGCFSNKGTFDLATFYAWLDARRSQQATCLFAVAPDVVGDAAATWERSREPLAVIREKGFPAALVAQDGLESMTVPWDAFDALFLGGTTRWKLSRHAHDLARRARAFGKWVHMGRVNSYRRLQLADWFGCHSADGTYLAFGPDINAPKMLKWLTRMEGQPCLPL